MKMKTIISVICVIYSCQSGTDAFTTWTRNGDITKKNMPLVTDYTLPTSKKRIKYFREIGNFLDKHPIVKLHDIRANYFDIQRKCLTEGMSVFLPANQAEIDDVVAIIPKKLEKKEVDGRTEISEDIYSGLYIRMSDMDYEGCWKTTGTNGVLRPYSQMDDQYRVNCPIQHFPHIKDNMVLDDGYDYQAGQDFMMLARKDKKFYDVSHMMTILDGGWSKEFMNMPKNSQWLEDEYTDPGSHAFHGILGVCEYPTDGTPDQNAIEPCNPDDYAMDFCVGHQKDIKFISGTFSYDDAEAQCSSKGSDWKLWYPETEEEETDTLAAIKEVVADFTTYWIRDAGDFQCRYNKKMVDPKDGVTSAAHYIGSGDYTLKDGSTGSHNVICEKVLDQYKEERKICESDRSLEMGGISWDAGKIKIINNDGDKRNLEYIGKTTYRRAHAICQAKGKQLFLPRDRNEIQDVFNIFHKIDLGSEVLGEPKDSYEYFEKNEFTELKYRPSAWIRYTDQDSEHCWLSDDQCNGGMKWTQWAYRWKSRITLGYYPRGQILQNTYLDRSNTNDDWSELKSNSAQDVSKTMNAQELDKNTFWISNYTEWLHQPDNWGTTKDQLFAYAKRLNEYGQQYAAIDGVSRLHYYGTDIDAEFPTVARAKNNGYPNHGHEDFYAQMHDTYNVYPRAFGFCEAKSTNCNQMNVLSENSQCLSRSVSASSLKKLNTKMTYEDAKKACMDEDMIIWLPDNLVEQNEVAKSLDDRGLLEAGDEVWLRLTFDEGIHPYCGDQNDPCTEDYCCCQDPTKPCKHHELSNFKNQPFKDSVGTWRIDYESTNSLTPTDPSPMHIGFSGYSTLDFNGHKNWTLVEQNPNYWKADEIDENNTPPWCRAKSFYYHWATDEPKNFKAVGKYHRNPTEAEKSLYAVYSHSHSGIPDGTGKDLNGDWVSKSGTDKAIVLCQTRDYWRHFILKRCVFTDGTNDQLPLLRPGSAEGTRPENHPRPFQN